MWCIERARNIYTSSAQALVVAAMGFALANDFGLLPAGHPEQARGTCTALIKHSCFQACCAVYTCATVSSYTGTHCPRPTTLDFRLLRTRLWLWLYAGYGYALWRAMLKLEQPGLSRCLRIQL